MRKTLFHVGNLWFHSVYLSCEPKARSTTLGDLSSNSLWCDCRYFPLSPLPSPPPPTLGFVDKNNNLLYRSLKEAANDSRDPIFLKMFPEVELRSQKRPPTVSSECLGAMFASI